MVEITEESNDAGELAQDKPAAQATDRGASEQDPVVVTDDKKPGSKWTELMGKDIQLKEISSDDSNQQGKECSPQDAVEIDFVGRLANDLDHEDGPIFHQAKDCLIVVGDKYVNAALELGVRFMREGQKAVIWSSSKFAYGMATRKHGDYELPPSSNVRYEVFVKRIYSPEEETSDPDAFQLKLGMSKKLIANDMFKNELYTETASTFGGEQRALRLYSKAAEEMLHLIQSHEKKEEEEGDSYNAEDGKQKVEKATEIMLDCLNNMVAVYMKSKKYHEAKEAAVKVLTYDPNNYKALLRAARAAMMDPAGTYEESDAAIAAAEKVVKEKGLEDKEVRKLRQELKQKKQEYKKRRKEMMARMTKELTPKDAKEKEEQQKEGLSENDKPSTEAGEDLEGDQAFAEEANQEANPPLWRRLLPYAFQIIFPFVLYFFVVSTSRPRQERERMEGEL